MSSAVNSLWVSVLQDHSIESTPVHFQTHQLALEVLKDLAMRLVNSPDENLCHEFNITYPQYIPQEGAIRWITPHRFDATSLKSRSFWEARFGCHELIDPLMLPNQRPYSYQEFSAHPLFKHTLEKAEVYLDLVALSQEAEFSKKYPQFLQQIQQESWFSFCRKDPILFAKLGLIAFLNNDIATEELCVIHTAAEAARELKAGGITSATIHVLTQENAEAFFQKVRQPPFNTKVQYPLIDSHKTAEELLAIKQGILDSIANTTSVLLRSAIIYGVSRLGKETPLEYAIYHLTNVRERLFDCKALVSQPQDVVHMKVALFPPTPSVNLYK
ncbi:MAG: hypothetical protein FJZ63_01190, partial [Chlamydiae bacterium]|nr:hypothetical protein [Chlamydiota bacterium]